MEINLKLFFIWMSCTITTVRQQTVEDPCPTNAPQTSIANMCQAEVKTEKDDIGNPRADSVGLRITTREDNCVCKVYLQNQTKDHTVFMSTYDKKTSAAPENPYCGLEINVSVSSERDNCKSLKAVGCTNGTVVQRILLQPNEILRFTSTLTEGKFTRGYCLQIFKIEPALTKYPALRIQCSQGMINETSNSQTVLEDAFSTQYVIIGACAGAFVFAIALVVVFMYTWRKRHNDQVIASNSKELTQMKSANHADYDSEGLKRNILYQTSEQCDIMDGNYYPVELKEGQAVNDTQNIDGDYISIDENVISNSKHKSKSGIQPKCTTTLTKKEVGYQVEHVTPDTGNNAEYAVVNKREKLGENTEHATSLNTEYAVVDKSARLDTIMKHVTPENDAFSTQYVIIGACAGAFVFAIALVVVFMYTWRKRHNDQVIASNSKELTQMKSANHADYDSEGLKRNILYQTSEQCDIMDGNYYPVELKEGQAVNDTQNIDGDYISIDENVISNSKHKSKSGIQPKCTTTLTKKEVGYQVEHVTPDTGNNAEYAVVNKREKLGENTEHATSLNTEYAVVDKSARLDTIMKHVTPENGSNVEYAVVGKNTQI